MFIIVAGAGRLGILLAKKLKEDKHQVSIIDKSEFICSHLSEELKSVLVIYGDATKPEILQQAKVEKADVLVSTTSSDADNIIICNIAKDIFTIKRTVARVNDPKHLLLYKHMNVDVPIDSTSILASIVEEEASFSDVMSLLSIKKGQLSIVRVDIPAASPIVNKSLSEISLPANSVFMSIVRGPDIIVPSGLTKIKAFDEVIAVTLIDNEKALIKKLIGKL